MLLYSELLDAYEKLKKENAELKAEIARLSGTVVSENSCEGEVVCPQNAAVDKFSSSQEKINLFRSLFVGREDVFAKRWHSKTTGKSGYQPVCGNEWDEILCDKRKYKCSTCPNRKLLPLSDKDIFNHLAGKDEYGRDIVGIYPMLSDETCNFCCTDFDDEGYEEAAKAFYSVCAEYDIPAYIERSRSGSGAHIWIFFSSPVKAKTARQFVSSVLTAAMERCSRIAFSSYDRMFPNQDNMPSGGFGNLIALPLQGKVRKNGNSVFVNTDFVPYKDQWAFLSSVRRVNEDLINDIISKLCKKNELGILMSESEEKPWHTVQKSVSAFDFPRELKITISNMIYIPKEKLKSTAINSIKRLAAFKNPDFYRTQAMRMSVYNKPRIICLAEDFDEYIAIPRGCKNALCKLFESAQVNYCFVDETNSGNPIDICFNGELREEQRPAAQALLSESTGVLSATTAFGKTVVGAYLIAQKKVNTLILVHTQSLMTQWKSSLEKFLEFSIEPPEPKSGKGRRTKWSPIGLLGGGKNTLHGYVDIAVMQSLVSENEVKELVRDYGMIITDECHHVSAVNFEAILKYANAKYVYGLTATPTRQDGHHPIIFMQCGDIRYKVDAKSQAEKRDFEHYLIPRFTSFRKNYENGTLISQIYSDLANSELRNRRISDDVISSLNAGRTPIVLTERKEHAEKLKEMLSAKCKNTILLTGAAGQKQKRFALEELESIPQNEELVVIATGKYAGEGFDYLRLDTLFLVLPIAWKGKVAQYAGRLHRNYPGKKEVLVYDYADIHIPVLERMYQKRLKGYASIGYKTRFETDSDISSDIIYDGKSFQSVYSNDIKTATKEIIIVSPFMRKNRIKNMTPILKEVINRRVCVTVITRPPQDFDGYNKEAVEEYEKELSALGVCIKFRSNFHQKFTVIDSHIVWYGSVNFLSYGTAEESIMRFESYDIAGELVETVI
ncbi:MAG: DEAD/DEAH box helicase family protein [Clostridia bacterium]|nr:DEAD/DEAH box helicase family protein [Clostridia bacterium]